MAVSASVCHLLEVLSALQRERAFKVHSMEREESRGEEWLPPARFSHCLFFSEPLNGRGHAALLKLLQHSPAAGHGLSEAQAAHSTEPFCCCSRPTAVLSKLQKVLPLRSQGHLPMYRFSCSFSSLCSYNHLASLCFTPLFWWYMWCILLFSPFLYIT